MLLYFPTNKKAGHQNQKKISWFRGLYTWEYITQSGSLSRMDLQELFPAADPRQVVQLEAIQSQNRTKHA